MKTRNFLFGIPMLLCVALVGCNNNENENVTPSQTAVAESLLAKYPDATNVSWTTKTVGGNTYQVADFSSALTGADTPKGNNAWFDATAKWQMTETDITYAQLPAAVKSAFETSEYAAWQQDDIEKLARNGLETIYVIDVKQNAAEVDIYYAEDGTLIKTVVDAADDNNFNGSLPPVQKPTSIVDFINGKYPGAKIVEIEQEDGMTEVEMVYNKRKYDVLFNASAQWAYTRNEVKKNELPAAVSQALAASSYATYYIDDIDFYETATEKYYLFDLESNNGDTKLKIAEAGTLTVVSGNGTNGGDGNGNTPVPNSDIKSFIEAKYSGAKIVEMEKEDGYTKVEFIHQNIEKEAYFNGAGSWVKTEWDVAWASVPTAVKTAIQGSTYAAYSVDDVNFVETPAGSYYEVEMEQGDREITLKITPQGVIS